MNLLASETFVQRTVDSVVGQVPAGRIPQVDPVGRRLADTGLTADWLRNRVTAYRNANGTLVLTTGNIQ